MRCMRVRVGAALMGFAGTTQQDWHCAERDKQQHVYTLRFHRNRNREVSRENRQSVMLMQS